MEQIYSVIANVGFPIAISMYLLIRIENRLGELTKSIHELNASIQSMTKWKEIVVEVVRNKNIYEHIDKYKNERKKRLGINPSLLILV